MMNKIIWDLLDSADSASIVLGILLSKETFFGLNWELEKTKRNYRFYHEKRTPAWTEIGLKSTLKTHKQIWIRPHITVETGDVGLVNQIKWG